MKHKNRIDKRYIEDKTEVNYNIWKPKVDNEAAMRQSMKLFREELLDLIETYFKPWL